MSNHIKDDRVLTVTGMGHNSIDGGKTVHMKKSQGPRVNCHTCKHATGKRDFDYKMMCTGCKGHVDLFGRDSGGPVVSKDGY